jgi:UDPglucose 6-dehydrogenase
MKSPSIAIVGYGFVGKAIHKLFAPGKPDLFKGMGARIELYDPGLGLGTQEGVNSCDYAFICVPTPPAERGRCDTSIVDMTVEWCTCPNIIIRSTVPPGTTERLAAKHGKSLVFQPEYIGETVEHPMADHLGQGFITLGGTPKARARIVELYQWVYNSDVRIRLTSARTAELAKYMENAWLATKVTFCHQFADFAEAIDVEYDDLRECWLEDPRITRSHTFVYAGRPGFTGKCLPKDTAAILSDAYDAGVDMSLLRAALIDNNRRRVNDPDYPLRGVTPR